MSFAFRLLIFISLSFASQTFAAWPHDSSDISPDPSIEWGELENGIRWAYLHNEEPPGRLSIRLLVQAGSLMETESQRGLAHFLEHMAFNGTEHYEAEEMVEYFQRLGMAFGADTNAHTSYDETVYKLELPEVNNAILDDSFKLLSDYAVGMKLGEEELEKERGIILAEKRTRDSVEYRQWQAEVNFSLATTKIARRSPIGLEKVISEAPREEFFDFYKTWYTSDRFVVVMVGDAAKEELLPYVEKYFGSIPENKLPRANPDLGIIENKGIRSGVHAEKEASSVTVSIQRVTEAQNQGDTQELRKKKLERHIANAMLSQRLLLLSKEENAPFSRSIAYAHESWDFVMNAGVEFSCNPDQWKATLTIAENELRRALEYGFHQNELDEFKAKIIHALEESVKQSKTRKNRDLSNALTKDISKNSISTNPQQELDFYKPILKNMTIEDCHQAFKNTWGETDRILWMTGNIDTEGATAADQYRVYEEAAQIPVEAIEKTEVKEWGYQSFDLMAVPCDITKDEELGISQAILGNKVRVNFKQSDFEAGAIHVSFRFGNGKLTLPKDKPGIDLLAEASFILGGLEEHSVDEIDSIMAGKSVNISFTVKEDALEFYGLTNARDLEKQLELMVAYLFAPGYREESLRLAQKEFEQLFKQLKHTAEGALQNQVASFLADGDYRFGFPTQEELAERNLDEVKEWLTKELRESYLEISIVGDFEEKDLLRSVRKTLGSLPHRKESKDALTELRKVQFPKGGQTKVFNFESEIPRAICLIALPTEDIWDISRTRRLSALASIFTDRMRKKIREEIGEAYSYYAYNAGSDTYTNRGINYAFVMCDPEQTENIANIVKSILSDLQKNGVSEDEKDRALKPMIKQIEVWRRNNRYWLNTVLGSSQEYPVRLEWAKSMEEDIASITAEELNKLAKKYYKTEQGVSILITPDS